MRIPYVVSHAAIVAALSGGVLALGPAVARAQDASNLPDRPALVTLTGCFSRQSVEGHEKYVLVNPAVSEGKTVPDANCAVAGTEPMIHLDNVHSSGLDQVALGRWIEVTGKLGRVKHADDIREMQVKAFKEVPVAPPAAAALPVPEPPAVAEAVPEPKAPEEIAPAATLPQTSAPASAPVATSGVKEELPKTASPLPTIALIGVMTIATGLMIGGVRRRRPLEEE